MKSLILFPFFLLAGCGAGGEQAAVAPNATPTVQQVALRPIAAKAASKTPKMLFISAYGDSTMGGATKLPDGSYAYATPTAPQALQTYLQASFGAGYTVTNYGIGGLAAADWVHNTGGTPRTWFEQMHLDKNLVVIFNFGIDDAYKGFTPQEFQNNIAELTREAREAGHIVIIETAQPINSVSPQLNALIGPLVAAELAYAEEANVPVINEYKWLSEYGAAWQEQLSDGIHPTAAGYIWKAQIEFNTLKPLILAGKL